MLNTLDVNPEQHHSPLEESDSLTAKSYLIEGIGRCSVFAGAVYRYPCSQVSGLAG